MDVASGINGACCFPLGCSTMHRQRHRFSSTNRCCERGACHFRLSFLVYTTLTRSLPCPTPERKLTPLTGDPGTKGSPRPGSGAKGHNAPPSGMQKPRREDQMQRMPRRMCIHPNEESNAERRRRVKTRKTRVGANRSDCDRMLGWCIGRMWHRTDQSILFKGSFKPT